MLIFVPTNPLLNSQSNNQLTFGLAIGIGNWRIAYLNAQLTLYHKG